MPARPLARFLALDGSAEDTALSTLEGQASDLLAERWRENAAQHALSSRQLDLFYRVKRFVPRGVQLTARRVLARRQMKPEFPAWPYDGTIAALLRRYAAELLAAAGIDGLEFPWFWPDRKGFAFVITHDVESAEGLRAAIELANIEEERGFRSSFNVVADWYPVDAGILRELRDRGFEIGVHGVHHDRSLFASRLSFQAQLPALEAAATEFGAVGFRSPATHRVVDWLPELPFDYDCTIPHSDPFEPQPGGCCSPWPFFIGRLVELPYTLPQDHTLFTLLGQKTIDVWLDQVDRLVAVNGLVQSVSHPDPGYLGEPRRRALFVEFLDEMSRRVGMWHALPRDVARWWRDRDAGDGVAREMGTIRRSSAVGDAVLEPPV